MVLKGRGFTRVYTLLEGLDAWKDEVLFPVMPQAPTPEQQAQFERAAQVATYFGGQPRAFGDHGAAPPEKSIHQHCARLAPRVVSAYYVLALLFPQAIWHWVFRDLRVSYYISVFTIIGFAFACLGRRVELERLRDKQNGIIALLFVFVTASCVFRPYGLNRSGPSYTDSMVLLEGLGKAYLFYFVAIILISDIDRIRRFCVVLVFAVAYYAYWANEQYFGGYMNTPRLAGPGADDSRAARDRAQRRAGRPLR
jgi:hypothetical protein